MAMFLIGLVFLVLGSVLPERSRYVEARGHLMWVGALMLVIPVLFWIGSAVNVAIHSQFPPPPPPPEVLYGIEFPKYDPGIISTDLVFKNATKRVLLDVDLTMTLTRENGQVETVKRFWSRWAEQETQMVNAPPGNYEKMTLKGKARAFGKDVVIDSAWRFR